MFWKRQMHEKSMAASKLQAMYRGRKGRDDYQQLRKENRAATKMQAGFRGRLGRKRFADEEEHSMANDKRVKKQLRRVFHRQLHQAFFGWRERVRKLLACKRLLNKHMVHLEASVFKAWHHRVAKRRKARRRIARNRDGAATHIAAWWRGTTTRWITDRLFEERWGSVTIQRYWRGCWRASAARFKVHLMRANWVCCGILVHVVFFTWVYFLISVRTTSRAYNTVHMLVHIIISVRLQWSGCLPEKLCPRILNK